MRIKIERSKEEINSVGGISIIGRILNKINNLKKLNTMKFDKVKSGTMSHLDIAKSFAGLLSLGKTDYADIEIYRKDQFFKDSLNLSNVPSEETLRQRLNELSTGEKVFNIILKSNVELLSDIKEFGAEKTEHSGYIPIDADVSVMDNSGSSKEGVSFSYAKVDGYAPMFAYIGTHGYMLNCELRPGSQHSNKGTAEFIQETLDAIKPLGLKNPLLRLDSGFDDEKLIELLKKYSSLFFLIKRNLRKESLDSWLSLAKAVGKCSSPRKGKNIYTGAVTHIYPRGNEELGPIFTVFEVIERTITSSGEELLIPEIEVNTWWTNLCEEPETVIEFYHKHGTSEQFHSELKSDLGLERLPSGTFSTNDLILRLGMLSFNALRLIGQTALECKDKFIKGIDVIRRRIRSVLQDFIYIACKRVFHSGIITLKFGRNNPFTDVFRKIYATAC